VRHFAAAKGDRGPNLVTLAEPLLGVFHAIVVIVIVRPRPKLDLLDLYGDLFLFRFVGTLLLFVKKLTVINEFANGRLSVRSDLDEVDAPISRFLDRIARVHHTQGFAVLSNNSY